ncbi:MAG: hemerythrin domain-containing protein [Acidobacteria bacterium]|nr:hemerythrin domain-containing protein [Acidobacteriota bacterium]MBI3662637.1 hemerythrin domain-containing protein [Acidobacteriota bacterium]
MKRHESLHPLSQHHHFALIQVWEMRRALKQPAAKRAAAVRAVTRKFVRFWKKAGQVHFREEEEVLLPAYARYARLDEDKDVMRMLAEHAMIRALIGNVEASLASGGVDGNDVATLAQTLHDHVRLEENEIFPRIEKILSEDEMRVMGKELHRLHKKGECAV